MKPLYAVSALRGICEIITAVTGLILLVTFVAVRFGDEWAFWLVLGLANLAGWISFIFRRFNR